MPAIRGGSSLFSTNARSQSGSRTTMQVNFLTRIVAVKSEFKCIG